MRRKELIDAVNEMNQAINDSGVAEALMELADAARSNKASESSANVLTALKKFAVVASNFKPATKELIDIFNLTALEDPSVWLQFLEPSAALFQVVQYIQLAKAYLPRIVKLIEQSTVQAITQSTQEANSKYKGMSVLTATVFEQGNLFSSPTRLAHVLESINLFYTSCALMSDESPSTLSVIACDSGSDKSFDFLGIARVMECVVKIIESLWDRVVFYKEHQFEERLDLITKSLPILVQINKLEEEKQIEPERAEILRRNIFDGSNKFIESGATIPQIESKSHYDARKLMSPVQKLLASSSVDPTQEDNAGSGLKEQSTQKVSDEANFSNLNKDEQETLRRLYEKAKGSDIKESIGSSDKPAGQST